MNCYGLLAPTFGNSDYFKEPQLRVADDPGSVIYYMPAIVGFNNTLPLANLSADDNRSYIKLQVSVYSSSKVFAQIISPRGEVCITVNLTTRLVDTLPSEVPLSRVTWTWAINTAISNMHVYFTNTSSIRVFYNSSEQTWYVEPSSLGSRTGYLESVEYPSLNLDYYINKEVVDSTIEQVRSESENSIAVMQHEVDTLTAAVAKATSSLHTDYIAR